MEDPNEFWSKQISLSEWFADAGIDKAGDFREEDGSKRDRLRVLNNIIDLPFDKPVRFAAKDLAERTSAVKNYIKEHENELCALRLNPYDSEDRNLRHRGLSVRETVEDWFDDLDIDSSGYRATFLHHSEHVDYATIFVVNESGVIGELIKGMP